MKIVYSMTIKKLISYAQLLPMFLDKFFLALFYDRITSILKYHFCKNLKAF